MRGLRQVRGVLSCRGGEAGAEALQKGRQRGDLSEDAPSHGAEVGRAYVDPQLQGREQDQLLRYGHFPLQNCLSSPYRGTGVSEAGKGGAL